VQSQQLLPQGKIFQQEGLSGTENTDQPAERMTQQHGMAEILVEMSSG
jgi:hypothetical protein